MPEYIVYTERPDPSRPRTVVRAVRITEANDELSVIFNTLPDSAYDVELVDAGNARLAVDTYHHSVVQ